jgi:hypothetical protein
MNNKLSRTFVLVIAMLLAACAAAPKIALRPEAKKNIKRIALIDIQEPAKYNMNPGQLPGGAAFYLLGALGGAILGGIEANRFEAATTRFNEAVSPEKPNLSSTVIDRLEFGLKQKGYGITRVPPPAMSADGKAFDLSKIEGTHDAVLTTSLNGGYGVQDNGVGPHVYASISLTAKSSTEQLFAETYIYNSKQFGQTIQIIPEARFTLESVDAVHTNIKTAAEGLKTGATKIAERILLDL